MSWIEKKAKSERKKINKENFKVNKEKEKRNNIDNFFKNKILPNKEKLNNIIENINIETSKLSIYTTISEINNFGKKSLQISTNYGNNYSKTCDIYAGMHIGGITGIMEVNYYKTFYNIKIDEISHKDIYNLIGILSDGIKVKKYSYKIDGNMRWDYYVSKYFPNILPLRTRIAGFLDVYLLRFLP